MDNITDQTSTTTECVLNLDSLETQRGKVKNACEDDSNDGYVIENEYELVCKTMRNTWLVSARNRAVPTPRTRIPFPAQM